MAPLDTWGEAPLDTTWEAPLDTWGEAPPDTRGEAPLDTWGGGGYTLAYRLKRVLPNSCTVSAFGFGRTEERQPAGFRCWFRGL